MMENFKIKPGLLEDWKKFVANNSTDSYSFGVVRAAIASFEALDEGKTPKEAEESWKGIGLTGFMAGAAANTISKFHERGEEFRVYWNNQFGVSVDNGTVNPAMLTFKG